MHEELPLRSQYWYIGTVRSTYGTLTSCEGGLGFCESPSAAAQRLELESCGWKSTLIRARIYKMFEDGRRAHHPSIVVNKEKGKLEQTKEVSIPAKITPIVPAWKDIDVLWGNEVDMDSTFPKISFKEGTQI